MGVSTTSSEVDPARADSLQRDASRPVLGVAVFLGGLLVTLSGSWVPSLWTDEAATISAARRSLPSLVSMAGHVDAVHATYYAFMHLWVGLCGQSAFLLRLPSAVATAACGVVVLRMGQRLGGSGLGLAAAAVFLVLPRATWMGIEARPYAASALVAATCTWVLLLAHGRWQETGRIRPALPLLVAYGALAALGVALNIYLLLLLVGHGLTLLSLRGDWHSRGAWMLAAVAGLLVASPVLWEALHQSGQLGQRAFGPLTWARNVAVNQWFLGETPTLSTGTAGSTSAGLAGWWRPASVVLAVLGWVLVVVGVVRRRSTAVLVWTVPWAGVVTLVVGGVSVLVRDVYSARYFTFAAPAMALLMGQGLVVVGRRAAVAWFLALLLAAAPVYLSQRQTYSKSSADWSRVAEFVESHKSPGDGVYFAPRFRVGDDPVVLTTRGVAVAYPRAFSGLVDVTAERTPVEAENLWGTSSTLGRSTARWQDLDVVWVVRRRDGPSNAQDDQLLRAAGRTVGPTWVGPLDEVLAYRKGTP